MTADPYGGLAVTNSPIAANRLERVLSVADWLQVKFAVATREHQCDTAYHEPSSA